MLSLACFVAVGLVLELLVPLRAFAFVSLCALAAYAALTSGFSGLGSVYDAIFAWVALQVGYFLAVLVYLAWPLLLEPTAKGTAVEPKLKSRDKHKTSPPDPNSSLPQ
jgi:small basic protein